jgi:hypothetical protein
MPKIIQTICDQCGEKVPIGVKSIFVNDKEIFICGHKCLCSVLIAEYEKPGIVQISTTNVQVAR